MCVVYLLHLPVLLERTHEAGLVLGGLEATMTKLGTGVDEFERNFLYKPLLSQSLQGLKTFIYLIICLEGRAGEPVGAGCFWLLGAGARAGAT